MTQYPSTPRIKICCIASVEEAAMAVAAGASALGLVSHMPSGPGVIGDELIAEIAARRSAGDRNIPAYLAAKRGRDRHSATFLPDQHDSDLRSSRCMARIANSRNALPGISIVQVVHVTGPESVEEAAALTDVDAILLDSGNQKLAVKELGGTGRTHDWSLSRTIRERVQVPLFLAGGLTPENVGQAIREVGPFGLDVCSGVRTAGKLDGEKLRRFFSAVGVGIEQRRDGEIPDRHRKSKPPP